MDKRKSYYLVFDTETANTIDNPLVYDIGWQIIDKTGKVYLSRSYVIEDIFKYEMELMFTAYYATKIPQYYADLTAKKRELISYAKAKSQMHQDCKKYNVKALVAHNARFDYRSTTMTQRYITKSASRYFLPYGIPLWDTMRMAQDVICPKATYKKFCKDNGYMCGNRQVRKTAEVLYQYITQDTTFTESHTGLEDVEIESQIFVYCLKQKKKMKKLCFN